MSDSAYPKKSPPVVCVFVCFSDIKIVASTTLGVCCKFWHALFSSHPSLEEATIQSLCGHRRTSQYKKDNDNDDDDDTRKRDNESSDAWKCTLILFYPRIPFFRHRILLRLNNVISYSIIQNNYDCN